MLTIEQSETLRGLKVLADKASSTYLDKFMDGHDDPELFALMCLTANAVRLFEGEFGKDTVTFPILVSRTEDKEVYNNGTTFTREGTEWKMSRA